MDLNNFDFSHAIDKFKDASDEMQDRISSEIIAEQEYKGQLEGCIFETRDILRKMQEDSIKESKINKWRFWINLSVAVVAAVAALISAYPYISSFVSKLMISG